VKPFITLVENIHEVVDAIVKKISSENKVELEKVYEVADLLKAHNEKLKDITPVSNVSLLLLFKKYYCDSYFCNLLQYLYTVYCILYAHDKLTFNTCNK
jgi:hypothetical protein